MNNSMITISKSKGLSDAKLDAIALQHFNNLSGRQAKILKFTAYKRGALRHALNYINANFRDIIISRPHDLEFHKNQIELYFVGLSEEDTKSIKKRIENIFNYKYFRRTNAIFLGESLNIKNCQYCGSQHLLIAKNSKGETKLRFELDHFYPKNHYPYLSLSFFNLIPSCSSCNKNKTIADTLISTHIHPHVGSSYNDISIFSLNNYDFAKYLVSGKGGIKINVKPRSGVTRTQKRKLENHETMFSLESIYSNHTDYAEELIWKSVAYPKEHRDELIEFLNEQDSDLILTIDDMERFIVGNYTKTDEYNNRPLAKMTYDLAKELKIVS